jgi:hypothetical protein
LAGIVVGAGETRGGLVVEFCVGLGEVFAPLPGVGETPEPGNVGEVGEVVAGWVDEGMLVGAGETRGGLVVEFGVELGIVGETEPGKAGEVIVGWVDEGILVGAGETRGGLFVGVGVEIGEVITPPPGIGETTGLGKVGEVALGCLGAGCAGVGNGAGLGGTYPNNALAE